MGAERGDVVLELFLLHFLIACQDLLLGRPNKEDRGQGGLVHMEVSLLSLRKGVQNKLENGPAGLWRIISSAIYLDFILQQLSR